MITVNGKQIECIEPLTITGLLKKMNYIFPLVIVKINNKNIAPDAFLKTAVKDGDVIEVIHMMSGG